MMSTEGDGERSEQEVLPGSPGQEVDMIEPHLPALPSPMFHSDGSVFASAEIAATITALEAMSTAERGAFRAQNAEAISSSHSSRILIVSGPGTGKSYLFMDRIDYWGAEYDGTILVTTFVKKLAADLNQHLLSSSALTEERKEKVRLQTLHAVARSILEKAQPWNGFEKNIRVVPDDSWDRAIWNDAASSTAERGAWTEFGRRRNEGAGIQDQAPGSTAETYRRLCRYYNAASFPEMILLAQQALENDASLIACDCAIVDELQDFNRLESGLLQTILRNVHSWLLAGDDDQVLYDTLKQSNRDLIVGVYDDPSVAKAMWPRPCCHCAPVVVVTLFMLQLTSCSDVDWAKATA